MVIVYRCCLLDIGWGGNQQLPWPLLRIVCQGFPQAANILSFQHWLCWISRSLHFVMGCLSPSTLDVCPSVILECCWSVFCAIIILSSVGARNEPPTPWSIQGCHFCAPRNSLLLIGCTRQWTSAHTVSHANGVPRTVLQYRWRPALPSVFSSFGFALELVVHEAWTEWTVHICRC